MERVEEEVLVLGDGVSVRVPHSEGDDVLDHLLLLYLWVFIEERLLLLLLLKTPARLAHHHR